MYVFMYQGCVYIYKVVISVCLFVFTIITQEFLAQICLILIVKLTRGMCLAEFTNFKMSGLNILEKMASMKT